MHHQACLTKSCEHVGDPVQMSMSAANEAQGTRVLVGGEVDIATAAELHGFISRAARPGSAALLIDLTAVTFIDSTGMRFLLLAAHEAETAKVGFSLLCPVSNTAVGRVLDILQIGLRIPIVATEPS